MFSSTSRRLPPPPTPLQLKSSLSDLLAANIFGAAVEFGFLDRCFGKQVVEERKEILQRDFDPMILNFLFLFLGLLMMIFDNSVYVNSVFIV